LFEEEQDVKLSEEEDEPAKVSEEELEMSTVPCTYANTRGLTVIKVVKFVDNLVIM
jgi:hypothetical protein